MPKRETDYSRSDKKFWKEAALPGETVFGSWHNANVKPFLDPEAAQTHHKLREKAKKKRPMPMGQGVHGRSRDVLR